MNDKRHAADKKFESYPVWPPAVAQAMHQSQKREGDAGALSMATASRRDRGRRSHRRTARPGPAERREILGRRPPATLAVSFVRTPMGGAQITVRRDDGVI